MNRFREWLRYLIGLFINSKHTTEWQGTTILIGLGVWLIIGQVFSTCPSVYWVMASVAKETTWGAIFIAVGLVQVFALTCGSLTVRRYMLLFKGALWTTLAVTLLFGDWHAPGLPVYLILAVTAFRSFLIYGRGVNVTV